MKKLFLPLALMAAFSGCASTSASNASDAAPAPAASANVPPSNWHYINTNPADGTKLYIDTNSTAIIQGERFASIMWVFNQPQQIENGHPYVAEINAISFNCAQNNTLKIFKEFSINTVNISKETIKDAVVGQNTPPSQWVTHPEHTQAAQLWKMVCY